MASKHTEQPGTDAAHIDSDRTQDTVVGTGEEPRVLPRPPVTSCLSPALSVTLNAALDRLLEVLGVDGGAVRLLEEGTCELVLVVQRGFSPQMVQDTQRLKAGEGLSGLALQQGTPIVVEHLSQHPTLANGPLRREGYESCMVVPLRLHGQLHTCRGRRIRWVHRSQHGATGRNENADDLRKPDQRSNVRLH